MNDQPNYIIFKLYRNSSCCFFSCRKPPLSCKPLSTYGKTCDDIIHNLDSLAKEHNRKMVFISSFGDYRPNFFVNTPYLEVLYNGELPQEERALYLGLVKTLFGDGDRFFGLLEAYTPAVVVRFSKLTSDDTFEVMPESNLDKLMLRTSPVKY